MTEDQNGIRLVLPEKAYAGDSAEVPDTIVVLTMAEPVKAGGDENIYFTGKE